MYVFAAIIVVIIAGYFIVYYKVTEGVVFTSDYFTQTYNDNNIIIDSNNSTLKQGNKTISYDKQFNSKQGIINADNKTSTSDILKNNSIPVPTFYKWNKLLTNSQNILIINKKLSYPLVVKTIRGTNGYGVTTNIINETKLAEHIKKLQLRTNNIHVEENVQGLEYRIMVFNDKIIDVVERLTPSVIGNGINTLKELVDKHENIENKTHNIDKQLLHKQQVEMSSIIKKGRIIKLSLVKNFSNGAKLVHISIKQVHPDNIAMFKRINCILDMSLTGIDYITPNISIPYYLAGSVIEVNHRPGFYGHYISAPDKQGLLDKFVGRIFTK